MRHLFLTSILLVVIPEVGCSLGDTGDYKSEYIETTDSGKDNSGKSIFSKKEVDVPKEGDVSPELTVHSKDTMASKKDTGIDGEGNVISEKCDSKDNDGDEVVDEKCACSYKNRPGRACVSIINSSGECKRPENFENKETLCDGIDNDCDNKVDEGCESNNCLTGECKIQKVSESKEGETSWLFVKTKCENGRTHLHALPESFFNKKKQTSCWIVQCPENQIEKVCK